MRHLREALVITFVAAVSAMSVRADPTQIWKLDVDRPVRWFKTSPAGVFLVGTDREILGVAPDSGNVLWRIGPIKDSNARDVELIADQPMALLQVEAGDPLGIPHLSMIDLRDGHTLRIQHEGLLRSRGSFVVPKTHDLLVLATTSRDGSRMTALRLDLASGVPTWTSRTLCDGLEPALLFESGSSLVRAHQVPFIDTDSSMVLHVLDGSFRRFDLNTGALVWSGRDRHARNYFSAATWEHRTVTPRVEYNPRTKQIETNYEQEERREFEFLFAPLLASSNGARFYAPYGSSVAAFSSASGQCLWPDPPNLQGSVAQMQETPAGLLVRTVDASDKKEVHHRVLLLDAETGSVRWRWPTSGGLMGSLYKSSYWQDATNFVVENDRVVIAAQGNIRTADLAHGREQTLGKLRFDHHDLPRTLLSGPGGYTVIGRSNLGVYAKADGQRIHHYDCEPPADAGWGLALLALSAITRGWIEPQLGLDALGSIPDLSRSTQVESYVYFLALMKDGDHETPGLVRVHLETAEPAGEIVFGTKRPAYCIDADGRLYFWSALKTIECDRF
jgi:putative pyrroloquinoline-quinone binding quinoprotein